MIGEYEKHRSNESNVTDRTAEGKLSCDFLSVQGHLTVKNSTIPAKNHEYVTNQSSCFLKLLGSATFLYVNVLIKKNTDY